MMLVFLFILGLFIGSFLNVLIDRLPREEQILFGRSHCDSCKHTLSWFDLVPVFSWCILGGRCRYCKRSIPSRNTLVELVTALLFGYIAYATVNPLPGLTERVLLIAVLECILVASLLVIFVVDFQHQIIPDSMLVTAGIVALILHIVSPLADTYSWTNYVASGLLASAFFLILHIGTKGRGMGLGDVKFAGFMGILLGYPDTLGTLYVAFLTGAVVSSMLLIRHRKKLGQTIAFGPFLVGATLLSYFGFLDFVWRYLLAIG